MTDILPICLFLLIFFVGVWMVFLNIKRKEELKKPQQIQNLDAYLSLVRPPDRLPRLLQARFLHHFLLGTAISAFLFFFAFLCMVNPDVENRAIACVILLVFDLTALAACFNTGKEKKQLHLELSSDPIKMGSTQIRYRDIHEIYYTRLRKKGIRNDEQIFHYMTVKGMGESIKVDMHDFTKKQLAEMINCCLYHNSSILIDEMVKDILVNRKIPALSARTFKQVRQ